MARTYRDGTPKPPLRERVAEAGGWFEFLYSRLVRYAGPAQVGPYDTVPEPERTERPCPLCNQPMSAHTIDRSHGKPMLHCP